MKSLAEALAQAAMGEAGVRFVDRNEAAHFIAYSALYARARRTAMQLRARGIKAQDVVALILPTCAAFYDAFFGAILLGAVPVALYPPMRLGRMELYHQQTADNLIASRAAIVLTNEAIRRLLGRTMALARPSGGCIAVESMQAEANGDVSAVCSAEPGLDDCAFLQLSSGTTAAPKVVGLTHRQIMANIGAIAQRLYKDAPLPPGVLQHTAVSWLPLYHDMGLVGCVLTALVDSTTLTLIPPELFVARPSLWLRTIARYRASISAAPNFAYSLCTERIRDTEMQSVDLSAWQVALNGAEMICADTIAAFSRRFAKWGLRPHCITPVYGLAEAALAVTFASPGRPDWVRRFDTDKLERLGQAVLSSQGQAYVSVGTPLAGYAVRIVDEDNNSLACGRKGHIQVRGPSVIWRDASVDAPMAGCDHDGATASPDDGWLNTGDIGFMHAQQLYIVGRHKDLIIIRGRNIAPHLIEAQLSGLAGVRSGCVVAVGHRPEGQASEVLVLLVERHRTHTDVPDHELVRHIETLVIDACQIKPETVALCAPGTLPRTSSGKLRRQAALAAFLANELGSPRQVSWWRLGLAMLHSKAVMPRIHTTPP